MRYLRLLTVMLLMSAASEALALGPRSPTFERTFCPRVVRDTLDTESIVFQNILEIEPITPGFALFEGPLWVDDALLLSHIGYQTDQNAAPADLGVLRNGQYSVLQAGYGQNGLTFDPRGFVVAARQKDGTVTRVINGKKLVETFNGVRFNSPNDLVFSSQGDLYFTDPDYQAPAVRPQSAERTYHVSTTGQVTAFGSSILKPNGIMLNLSESKIYVGGLNGLFAFRLRRDGTVIDQPRPVQPQTITEVDGLSKDCAGNLYVTAENSRVVVLAARTEHVLATYPIAGVTNVAFGGSDGKTLFATAFGARPQVWSARTNVPGFPF